MLGEGQGSLGTDNINIITTILFRTIVLVDVANVSMYLDVTVNTFST